jgi:hypothetical protein
MRSRLYSLRNINGKPTLDFSLGLKIINETTEKIELQLSSGIVTLQKRIYLNTFKIWDNGEVYFFVCTKAPAQSYVFKKLLEYSITKIDNRVEKLNSLKADYSKILAA